MNKSPVIQNKIKGPVGLKKPINPNLTWVVRVQFILCALINWWSLKLVSGAVGAPSLRATFNLVPCPLHWPDTGRPVLLAAVSVWKVVEVDLLRCGGVWCNVIDVCIVWGVVIYWLQDGAVVDVFWPLPSVRSIEYIKCTLLALAATLLQRNESGWLSGHLCSSHAS